MGGWPRTPQKSLPAEATRDTRRKPAAHDCCRFSALLLLAVSEWNSDVVKGIAGANSHQDVVPVVSVRCFDRVTDVTGVCHALSSNFENNITFLEASFRGRALRIDVRDNDAAFAGTRNCTRRCYRQTKLRNVGTTREISVCLLHGWQLAQGKIDDLVLPLVQNVELDRVARRKTADGTGEISSVFDRLAVHCSNDIAGFDT